MKREPAAPAHAVGSGASAPSTKPPPPPAPTRQPEPTLAVEVPCRRGEHATAVFVDRRAGEPQDRATTPAIGGCNGMRGARPTILRSRAPLVSEGEPP